MKSLFSARRGFYRELFVLVIPIVIRNLIASAVGMADVVMLGRVDQTSISASSLAGQVMFLLNVLFFGLNSAFTILASQYWGKRDTNVISKILGIGPFPEMGIAGAALATTLSWGIGLIVCVIDFLRQKTLPKNIANMFRIPKALIADFPGLLPVSCFSS